MIEHFDLPFVFKTGNCTAAAATGSTHPDASAGARVRRPVEPHRLSHWCCLYLRAMPSASIPRRPLSERAMCLHIKGRLKQAVLLSTVPLPASASLQDKIRLKRPATRCSDVALESLHPQQIHKWTHPHDCWVWRRGYGWGGLTVKTDF